MIKGNTKPEMLRGIPTEETNGYRRPIPHHLLYETLVSKCERLGWTVGRSEIGLSKDESGMAVALSLIHPSIKVPGATLSLGLTHSNDGHHSLRFYYGLVEDSRGIVLTENPYKRKHTAGLSLDIIVLDAVTGFMSMAMGSLPYVAQKLRGSTLTQDDVTKLLMQAGRDSLIPWSRIGHVDSRWRKSNHMSIWSLLKCFSKVARMSPPMVQMRHCLAFARSVLVAQDQDNVLEALNKMEKV